MGYLLEPHIEFLNVTKDINIFLVNINRNLGSILIKRRNHYKYIIEKLKLILI